MAEISEQNRWEKELAQFQKVLANPTGQAIVIVGPEGSGKSALLTILVAHAKKVKEFQCDGNIHRIGPGDHPNNILGAIGKGTGGPLIYLSVGSIIERLSNSVEEFGDLHRRVIGVDAKPKQPASLMRWWLDIIPNLPEKVKFIFTQRPDGILATNKEFVSLPNVVRMDIEKNKSSNDISAQSKYHQTLMSFLLNEKGCPGGSVIAGGSWQETGEYISDVTVTNPQSEKTLAIIEVDLRQDGKLFIREASELMKKANLERAPLYVFTDDVLNSGDPFGIVRLTDNGELEQIYLEDFPSFKDLRRKAETKTEDSLGEVSDVEQIIDTDEDLRIAFEKHLVEEKGYTPENYSTDEEQGELAVTRIWDNEQKILALMTFCLERSRAGKAFDGIKAYKKKKGIRDVPNYVIFASDVLDGSFRMSEFGIMSLTDKGDIEEINFEDFPSYGQLYKIASEKTESFDDEKSGKKKLEASVSENVKVQGSVTVEIVEKLQLWEMSSAVYANGDSETEKDTLGFEPYVEAVAEFLVHEKTKPPLTISIEGEWGSGKSSFMLQLQNEIRRIYSEQNKGTCFVVEFDPWRHEKNEAMWAAFALKFIKDSAKSLTKWEQCIANFELWKKRFQWKKAKLDLIRVILISAIWILSTVAIAIGLWKGIKLGTNGTVVLPKWIGSFIAVAVSAWGAFGKVKDFCGSPLAVDLKKYMKRPDYISKISFIEKFHEDFEKIVKSYAKDKRVYVFIDDLDRCEIPKAAELMESINLMLSDKTKLVFIMGMDREKVAAGLAVKHEKLLPYLSGLPVCIDESDKDKMKRKGGIWYGYSFIEKFIQIPFVLPTPSKKDINNMLLEMVGEVEDRVETKHDDQEEKKTEEVKTETPVVPGEKIEGESVEQLEQKPPVPTHEEKEVARAERKEIRKEVMWKFEGDDKNFREVVLMVSEAFGNNPRRVKQFVNLYRLRIRTAASTGLITREESQFTFAQLGKFVGIGLGWPLFIRDLERNNKLLDNLVDIAEGEKKQEDFDSMAVREWKDDNKLIRLIKSGCFDDKGEKKPENEYRRFCMRGLDIERLLKISPRIIQGEMEQVENLGGTEAE